MAYTSDWHNIAISYYQDYGTTRCYFSRTTLESIVSLFEAHWKVEDIQIRTYTSYVTLPFIVNDNLGYGFTWASWDEGNATKKINGFVIAQKGGRMVDYIKINQGSYLSAGNLSSLISNMQVCVPNAQNVVFKYYAGDEKYNLMLSAMKNRETDEFETMLITRSRNINKYTWDSNTVCYSLNDGTSRTLVRNEKYVRNAYNTNNLSRILATACVYNAAALYESPNVYLGINDLSCLENPMSIVIDGIEYMGINMNPYVFNWNEASYDEFNYYFMIESED